LLCVLAADNKLKALRLLKSDVVVGNIGIQGNNMDEILESIENVPSSVYYGGVAGSILVSLALYLTVQKERGYFRWIVGTDNSEPWAVQQTAASQPGTRIQELD
jgi:hypothetical protein